MKCLVTGATGCIGTVLVNALSKKGYDVTSLVLEKDETAHIIPYSRVIYGDICDASTLDNAFRGMDAVIHLAGIVDITVRNKELMRKVNIGGIQNVIRSCKNNGIHRLIYVSSVHAIPELPDGQEMGEPVRFDPALVEGMYAKTKAAATRMVLEAAREGLDVVVVHPAGVIGPDIYQLSNIGQMIVDFLCGGLTAYIDGKYNFVDVRDVADGIISALEKGKSGECYILSGNVVTVEEMLKEVSRASGKKMLRNKLPYWFALGTSYLAEFYYCLLQRKPIFTHYSMKTLKSNCNFSHQKARRELGYSVRPFEKSIRDMTGWICSHFVVKVHNKYKRCDYRD